MIPRALLISPAPVDGYPPVQAQARLLARAGFAVTLITTVRRGAEGIAFGQPGVDVITMRDPIGRFGGIRRLFSFVCTINSARRNAPPLVEASYEPLAMLYSDLARHKPPHRIAHFHESLSMRRWIERRLRGTVGGFDTVVVPDAARGDALVRQLRLRDAPFVIPNYPLKESNPVRATNGATVEVVYCGVLGRGQNLPLILESVPLWPKNTRLTLIGDCDAALGPALQAQVAKDGLADRVRFSGWIDLADLPARLAQADLGLCLLNDAPTQFRTALGACNKRYQYMQAGLAQIGDRNPGVAGLLEGQRIGRCLGSYSSQDLARIVRGYVEDRAALAAEGRRAALLHQRRFNYQLEFAPLLARLQRDDQRAVA